MTDLRQAAQQALEALESGLAFAADATVLQNLRTALEQPDHHDPIGDAQDKLIAEQQQAEPPEWLMIKNILSEYGL